MKHRFTLIILSATVALAGTGCTAWISVRKATDGDSTPGVRYSAPAVFLVGKPAADGTIEYAFEYWPDESNTYAISSYSFMSKQKVEATVADGLLAKVTGKQDTTDVAKALLDSSTKFIEEQHKQEVADANAAKTKKDAANTAAKAKVDAAQIARDAAVTAENSAMDANAKAEKALEFKPDDVPTKIALENAKIDFMRAQKNTDLAEQRLADAKNIYATIAAGGVPGGNAPVADPAELKAWSWIVYRVKNSKGLDGEPEVELVPAKYPGDGAQIQALASKKKAAPKELAKAPEPDLTLHSSPVVYLPADGKFAEVKVDASAAFNKLISTKLFPKPSGGPQLPISSERISTREVVIALPPDTPVGEYRLEVTVEYGFDPLKQEPPKMVTFNVTVAKEPKK
jgi:hypothetical protein